MPEAEPFFSVVMPAYNRGSSIGNAVKTLISQSYTSWELIVVDDCSSDDTVAEVQRFGDPRIRLITLRTNSGGPSVPRNVGMTKARGDWICFLDPDDLYAPGYLETMHRLIETHGDRNFYVVPLLLFSEREGRIRPLKVSYMESLCKGRTLSLSLSSYISRFTALVPCVPRWAVRTFSLVFPVRYKVGEDFAFRVGLFKAGLGCMYYDVPLYLWGRISHESLSRQRFYDEEMELRMELSKGLIGEDAELMRARARYYGLLKNVRKKNYRRAMADLFTDMQMARVLFESIYEKQIRSAVPLIMPSTRRCIGQIVARTESVLL